MNDKIKTQFMAQYLFQEVFTWAVGIKCYILDINTINTISTGGFTDGYLLLRTVDMLTDEEVENLFKLITGLDTGLAIFRHPSYIRLKYSGYYFDVNTDGETSVLTGQSDEYGNEQYLDFWSTTSAYQYFISIGILLPFTYLNQLNQPVTLTPDEIIALGWCKIK